MLTPPHFRALEADTRAFALVGSFMGYFALLEAGIDAAIGEVLGVDGIRRAIVGRNMAYDDKIKTLRSLVDVYVGDESLKKSFDKLAVKARRFGEYRNIIAHTPFRHSSKSDGVEFLRVTATSKIDFPEMDWSVAEFVNRIDDMNTLDNDLRAIEQRMSLQRIAYALANDPSPPTAIDRSVLGGLFGLGQSFSNYDDTMPTSEPDQI